MSGHTPDKAAGGHSPANQNTDIKTQAELKERQDVRAQEKPSPPAPSPFSAQLASFKAQAARANDQRIASIKQSLTHASNKLNADMKAASIEGRMRAAFTKARDRSHGR